jgi:hypothetical protein
MTSALDCEHRPITLPFEPLKNGLLCSLLFFRQLPASSLFYRMRFISDVNFLAERDMLDRGVNVWKKKLND